MLLVPDLSEYQANASMPGIRAMNGGAAIIRAAYGESHTDLAFGKLRAAAADFPFLGIYHYVTASQDVTAQAEAFLKIVGKLASHEIPILDLEEGSGNQESRANTWFNAVDSALGLASRPLNERSWLYSDVSFAESSGLAPVFATARHTWVAAFGSAEPSLGHTLWQSTNGVFGIHITTWPGAGNCDTSVYNGTLAQLAALSGRYEPPAAPVVAPVVKEWITAGQGTLASLAASHQTEPSTILRLTLEHSPGSAFPANVAAWLDDIFAGTAHPQEPMPKGLALYLPF
jgi:hypothetical protein